MRKLLIALAILVILLPVVIIVGNITGKTLIRNSEYFFVVIVFIAMYLLYDKKKTDAGDNHDLKK